MLLAVVLLLDPGLGRDVEEREGKVPLALEHGEQTTFDLSPEGLLLSVLLRGIGKSRVMDNAESLEPLGGLGGKHRSSVVGEQGAGQAALVECLRQCVDERLCGFLGVPLQVTAESGAVIEDAQQMGLCPLPVPTEDGARALVKVEVPETVDVGDLERAPLAYLEGLFRVARSLLPCPEETSLTHVPSHRRVARKRGEARVLSSERAEIVVVELNRPSRMLAVEASNGVLERHRHARMGAGVLGHSASEDRERVGRPASKVEPALDRLEGEADG